MISQTTLDYNRRDLTPRQPWTRSKSLKTQRLLTTYLALRAQGFHPEYCWERAKRIEAMLWATKGAV